MQAIIEERESEGVKGGQLGIVDQLVFSFTPHSLLGKVIITEFVRARV